MSEYAVNIGPSILVTFGPGQPPLDGGVCVFFSCECDCFLESNFSGGDVFESDEIAAQQDFARVAGMGRAPSLRGEGCLKADAASFKMVATEEISF